MRPSRALLLTHLLLTMLLVVPLPPEDPKP